MSDSVEKKCLSCKMTKNQGDFKNNICKKQHTPIIVSIVEINQMKEELKTEILKNKEWAILSIIKDKLK